MAAATVVIRSETGQRIRLRSLVAERRRRRTLATIACVLLAFAAIAGQLVRLSLRSGPEMTATLAEPLTSSWSRPDILDRNGRLIATDVAVHSLYADPQQILDLDEAVEKLSTVLGGVDPAELRKTLGDKTKRFAWVARGLAPRLAQRVHDFGLPGIAFRTELKRAYPLGALAGHVIGAVNIDNKGLAGIERTVDEMGRPEPVHGPGRTQKAPLRLSLDIGVQHALADELKQASATYGAAAAAGLILDANTGEIVAAESLPEADPSKPADWRDAALADRLFGGTYELGSVFKTLTVAMALEAGTADLDKVYDVTQPLKTGPFTITDLHSQNRPLSVREIFLHSSNIGAGMLARELGARRQRALLDSFGLLEAMRTEAGPVAAPQLPKNWGDAETITIAYGHGLAVAPLQFAVAVATLVNGGNKVTPTLLTASDISVGKRRIVSAETSAKIREIMRLNVTHAAGTGRRAEADGYRVGGKTGTAELPGRGGYNAKAQISSFVGAFPMDGPKYVTLILLFEPQTGATGGDHATAGLNAAPATARIVARVAPLLGVLPRRLETRSAEAPLFDAPRGAQ
jgi:cell division protein FtsI (penicillin-binding protein 3)